MKPSLLAVLMTLVLLIAGCATTKSSSSTPATAKSAEVAPAEVQTVTKQQPNINPQPPKPDQVAAEIEALKVEILALKAKIEASKPQELQWVKAEAPKATVTPPPQTVVPPNANPPQVVVVETPKAAPQAQATVVAATPPTAPQSSEVKAPTTSKYTIEWHTVKTVKDGKIRPVMTLKEGNLVVAVENEKNPPAGFVAVAIEVTGGVGLVWVRESDL